MRSRSCCFSGACAGSTENRFRARVDGGVAARLEIPGKPAPDTFLAAAEQLDVDPQRAVVVEDAISGVQAGRAGGFGLVIGVDRHCDASALMHNGADVVVEDPGEMEQQDVGRNDQMAELQTVAEILVTANRILAREGVVDAYGHISARHPDDAERYLLARSRSPELVEVSDILEFSLDGRPALADPPPTYTERAIHGAIYEARPDVQAVVHNHSYDVIPFSVTQVPLRAVFHVGGRMGAQVPVWDIRDGFGDTNLLVVNMEQGRDLAACLGQNRVVLMRGHGCCVADASIQDAVMTAIYVQLNARIQMDAMKLGEVKYLSPGEIAARPAPESPGAQLGRNRVWEYLCRRAGL